MADEDAQVGVAGEALLDPAVVLAPDLALVEVGLGRVDGDERHVEAAAPDAQARVPSAECVLEVDVADVARVVVAGHADDLLAASAESSSLSDRILVGVAVVGQVAGHDDEVGRGALISAIAVRSSSSW